jgi:hypothetical protein
MNGDGTNTRPGLEHCPDCARPFVVPVALLDVVDEGLYLLALECKNCGRLAVGVIEDAEVELLERFSASAAAEMEAAVEIVEVARFIDELGTLRSALEHDVVLPEDF